MLKHSYGQNVHIVDRPTLSGLLATLCHPETFQPRINQIVEILYRELLTSVLDHQFPRETITTPTRMTQHHPDQMLDCQKLRTEQKTVIANLARAGTWPSQVCYDLLHNFVKPEHLRQDHIFAARKVNSQNQVIGTDLSASKIGGDLKDSILIIPDPMGATGTTLCECISMYKNHSLAPAKKIIALHLIVTPEYLKKVTTTHPEVVIYALRLDRGLSPKAVLESEPGTFWDQEKGLNENDYIVPGGGGFGEIMNNSFV